MTATLYSGTLTGFVINRLAPGLDEPQLTQFLEYPSHVCLVLKIRGIHANEAILLGTFGI
jgi:hypothetical protein